MSSIFSKIPNENRCAETLKFSLFLVFIAIFTVTISSYFSSRIFPVYGYNEALLIIIWGIPSCIIFSIFQSMCQKATLKKISYEYPDEKIFYIFKFPFALKYGASFFILGIWGGILLPQMFARNFNGNLFLLIIMAIIASLGIVLVLSLTTIVTNKQLIKKSYFDFINKPFRYTNIPYSEMKSIAYINFLILDIIKIITLKNEQYTISGDKNLRKVNTLLLELTNEEDKRGNQ